KSIPMTHTIKSPSPSSMDDKETAPANAQAGSSLSAFLFCHYYSKISEYIPSFFRFFSEEFIFVKTKNDRKHRSNRTYSFCRKTSLLAFSFTVWQSSQ
ncbi:MAG TPA: hypothetical protein IAA06_15915, partial [Candidatus Blautia faecavium]|nr:hypothetical protein [Candidatus Blautia faecavium]